MLERTQLPSLKITLKSTSENSFEIISSPTYSNNTDTENSPVSSGYNSELTVDHLIANLADDNNKEAHEEGDFGLSEEQDEHFLNDHSDTLGIGQREREGSFSPSLVGVEDFISGSEQGELFLIRYWAYTQWQK